jgi:hypothetical protein
MVAITGSAPVMSDIKADAHRGVQCMALLSVRTLMLYIIGTAAVSARPRDERDLYPNLVNFQKVLFEQLEYPTWCVLPGSYAAVHGISPTASYGHFTSLGKPLVEPAQTRLGTKNTNLEAIYETQ